MIVWLMHLVLEASKGYWKNDVRTEEKYFWKHFPTTRSMVKIYSLFDLQINIKLKREPKAQKCGEKIVSSSILKTFWKIYLN